MLLRVMGDVHKRLAECLERNGGHLNDVIFRKYDFWCRIHLWFRLMGVCKQSRWRHSVTVPSRHKMADMRYYGNVMTTTRWWLCVTMATLWQQQDGGYALLWKSYDILHLQQYSHRLNLLYVLVFNVLSVKNLNALMYTLCSYVLKINNWKHLLFMTF